jgi:hypothetical protein
MSLQISLVIYTSVKCELVILYHFFSNKLSEIISHTLNYVKG